VVEVQEDNNGPAKQDKKSQIESYHMETGFWKETT
jgi:hypothetical protein